MEDKKTWRCKIEKEKKKSKIPMPEKRNHSFLLPLLLFLFTLFNDAFGDSNPHEDHDQPFTDWSQLSPGFLFFLFIPFF